MRKSLLSLVTALASLAAVASAGAQNYPTRPITMIVPFPAGGATDTLGRLLGERMRTALGQPIIIENVAGAAGSIGVGRAARAAADGYTLSIGTLTTHVLIGGLYALQFDLLNDLEPVAQLAAEPLLIVGKKSLPANDLKELIAWLKANPDKASVGIAGVGATGHLTGISFQRQTGTSFQFVPYRGAAPAMQDLLAGQIDLFCPEAGQTLAQYRAGSIKAYAVLTQKRWFAAPDVPMIDEAGVPGLHMPFWHGLWAPKGTPKDVIATLNGAVVDALADPAVRQRLTDLGHEIAPREQQSPTALAAYHKAEIEKWWPIIKAANIKLQ